MDEQPSEMIQRVAMAMTVADLEWGNVRQTEEPAPMDVLARAAIEAMREPTEAMLKAFYGDTPVEQWLGNDWRDMIDAALK